MKRNAPILPVLTTLSLIGLGACSPGTHGDAVVDSDPVAMRTAPAGTATLAFLDLEGSIRPDALPTRVALPPSEEAFGLVVPPPANAAIQATPSGSTPGSLTYTFTHAKAASGGELNGTLTNTTVYPAPGKAVHTQVFDLTATLDGTRSARYTGSQTITVTGSTATLSGSATAPLQVAYLDSANASNNKTYTFTPALSADWSVPGRLVLDGSYSFNRAGGDSITATIQAGAPLVWNTGCNYPASGTLALTLAGPTTGTASTTAVFGPLCGRVSLSGGTLTLGSL